MTRYKVHDFGEGLFYLPMLLSVDEQREVVDAVERLVLTHPWAYPHTPTTRRRRPAAVLPRAEEMRVADG